MPSLRSELDLIPHRALSKMESKAASRLSVELIAPSTAVTSPRSQKAWDLAKRTVQHMKEKNTSNRSSSIEREKAPTPRVCWEGKGRSCRINILKYFLLNPVLVLFRRYWARIRAQYNYIVPYLCVCDLSQPVVILI